MSKISATRIILKKINKSDIMINKNGTKMYQIAHIMTLKEHILEKREIFKNNTTISISTFLA